MIADRAGGRKSKAWIARSGALDSQPDMNHNRAPAAGIVSMRGVVARARSVAGFHGGHRARVLTGVFGAARHEKDLMIAVNGLSYTYPAKGETPAPTIKGIDFEIGKGEIFGFLGPSGSGKSTTQKLMTGILSGYQGRIEVMGRELRDWDASYYRHVGVGFELPNHFPKLSARENLELFAAFHEGRVLDPMALLERLGLKEHADKRVSDFSKGMKMRLNFARAVLHRPQIVFLDEPTAGLDPINARAMREMIRELRDEGRTIFLTTHNMLDAEELCDRIAFMVDGTLAAVGVPADMKRTYGESGVMVEYRDAPEAPLQRVRFELASLASNAEFQRILAGGGIWSIHTQEASVEEIFVRVTGTTLA